MNQNVVRAISWFKEPPSRPIGNEILDFPLVLHKNRENSIKFMKQIYFPTFSISSKLSRNVFWKVCYQANVFFKRYVHHNSSDSPRSRFAISLFFLWWKVEICLVSAECIFFQIKFVFWLNFPAKSIKNIFLTTINTINRTWRTWI